MTACYGFFFCINQNENGDIYFNSSDERDLMEVSFAKYFKL